MMPMIVTSFRAALGIACVYFAHHNLKVAQEAHQSEDWCWARHFMLVSSVWSVGAAIIGAIIIGSLQ
jgi:hypothetical protein